MAQNSRFSSAAKALALVGGFLAVSTSYALTLDLSSTPGATATFSLQSTEDCTNEAYRTSLEAGFASALGINYSIPEVAHFVLVPYGSVCERAIVYPTGDISFFSEEALLESTDGTVQGISDIFIHDPAARVNVSCTNVQSSQATVNLNLVGCDNNAYRNALTCMIAGALGMVSSNSTESCVGRGVFVPNSENCSATISWAGYEYLTGGDFPVWNETLRDIVDQAADSSCGSLVATCA